jgi:hypothetical protein
MELRILTWLFPWLMAALEFLLRNSLHDVGAIAFIGPTVGGAALGMMLPFTRARFRKPTARPRTALPLIAATTTGRN